LKNLINILLFIWNHPLNRGNRLGGVGRFLRWQIASRLIKGPIAFEFVDSSMLFASRGLTGATGNFYCGLHEFEEMAFIVHFLRANDTFIDVGANIGSYTILAAVAGANVMSFEPIPSTFVHLKNNVLLNHFSSSVKLFQSGVSNKTSTLRFTCELDTVNHVLVEGDEASSIEVPVIRLDDVVKEASTPPILMKIDVEGHELSVLQGAANILADQRLQAVIMEINGSGLKYGISDAKLLELMRGIGFECCSYEPFTRKLVQFIGGSNVIFIRNRSIAEERLQGSKYYHLINGRI